MKDWIFKTDEYICDLRTVGVLVVTSSCWCSVTGMETNMPCPVVMQRSVKLPSMGLFANTRKKPERT